MNKIHDDPQQHENVSLDGLAGCCIILPIDNDGAGPHGGTHSLHLVWCSGNRNPCACDLCRTPAHLTLGRLSMNVYVASKVWHAPAWREHRADLELEGLVNVTSRWIDYADDSDIVQNRKGELWQQCLEDIQKADAMIVYCDRFDEQQRGVLVEAGHAIALGKPVICINTCETFTTCGTSDVAFTRHPLWWWANFESGKLSASWQRQDWSGSTWWLDMEWGIEAALNTAFDVVLQYAFSN